MSALCEASNLLQLQTCLDVSSNAAGSLVINMLDDIDVADQPSINIYSEVIIDGSKCSNSMCKIFSSTTGSCGWSKHNGTVLGGPEDTFAADGARPPFFISKSNATATFRHMEFTGGCVGLEADPIAVHGSVLCSENAYGVVVFEDCYIHHNHAEAFGGVVFSTANLLVNVTGSTTIEHNTALFGGVAGSWGNLTISVEDDAIVSSNAGSHTGAVAYSFDDLVMIASGDSQITLNSATAGGGVGYAQSDFHVFASGEATFSNNAGGNGAIGCAEDDIILDACDNSKFVNNAVLGDGGLVYGLSDVIIRLHDSSEMSHNVAEGKGGVAVAEDDVFLDLSDNVVMSHNSAGTDGAVAYAYSDISFTATGKATFHHNEAGTDGGVLHAVGDLDAFASGDSTFVHNKAGRGGGVFNAAGDVTIKAQDSAHFGDNVATKRGAVGCSGRELGMIGSVGASFADNEAELGGVFWSRNSLRVYSSGATYTDNMATHGCLGYVDEGGLLFVADATTLSNTKGSNCALVETGNDDFSEQDADAICNNVLLGNTTILWNSEDSFAFNMRGSLNMFLKDVVVEPSMDRLTNPDEFEGACYAEPPFTESFQLEQYDCGIICEDAPSVILLLTVPEVTKIALRGSVDSEGEVPVKRVLLPDALVQQSCNVLALSVSEANQCPILTQNTMICTAPHQNNGQSEEIPSWVWGVIGIGALLMLLLLAVSVYYIRKSVRSSLQLRRMNYELLCKAIPEPIAVRLQRGEVVRESIQSVVPVFGDIEGYTAWSQDRSSEEVIGVLDDIFRRFDAVCDECGLLKVKTVGDCYMCVAGCLEYEKPHMNLLRATIFSWKCIEALGEYRAEKKGVFDLHMRFGLCEGPVSAGVIGSNRLQYDLWSDTVNTAARMESSSVRDHLRMTDKDARVLIRAFPGSFVFSKPERISVKGKGKVSSCLLLDMRVPVERQAQLLRLPSQVLRDELKAEQLRQLVEAQAKEAGIGRGCENGDAEAATSNEAPPQLQRDFVTMPRALAEMNGKVVAGGVSQESSELKVTTVLASNTSIIDVRATNSSNDSLETRTSPSSLPSVPELVNESDDSFYDVVAPAGDKV